MMNTHTLFLTLEWLSAALGILGVALALRGNILTWPVALLATGFTGMVMAHNNLWAQGLLQLFFLGTSVSGWYMWKSVQHVTENQQEDALFKPAPKLWVFIGMLIGGAGTFVLDYALSFAGPQDQYHLADSALASFSLVAQVWLGRKWVENWALWILVNASCVALFLDKEMWGYAFYFAILGIMAVLGLIRGVKKKPLHNTLQTGVGKALV